MEWIPHGERMVYESPWMSVGLVDIEIPGGRRFEHHVLHNADASGAIVHDPERGMLLLWRHRFVSDSWGWEIPAGRIDADETPIEAAVRETVEETGWQPHGLTPLVSFFPVNGLSSMKFNIFFGSTATYVGEPSDPSESERVDWLPLDRLRGEILSGNMSDGLSLSAVSYFLAFGANHSPDSAGA